MNWCDSGELCQPPGELCKSPGELHQPTVVQIQQRLRWWRLWNSVPSQLPLYSKGELNNFKLNFWDDIKLLSVQPITRAISPPRVYYPNISSHVQYITSPITRAAPLSVKSSDLSRELEHIERKFGRLERKHRRKVGASDSEDESVSDVT